MTFPCTKCGLCCRKTDAIKAAGLPVRSDGACAWLGPDNQCVIYADRPAICRTDVGAKKWFFGENDYYRRTARICNKWIKEAGLPSSYEVKIP